MEFGVELGEFGGRGRGVEVGEFAGCGRRIAREELGELRGRRRMAGDWGQEGRRGVRGATSHDY